MCKNYATTFIFIRRVMGKTSNTLYCCKCHLKTLNKRKQHLIIYMMPNIRFWTATSKI